MDILVKNFGGVARATLNNDGEISLIAGMNEAGKTSILTPISLALARQPCAITGVTSLENNKKVFLKRDYTIYVKEGEAEALAQIENDDGAVTLSWPAGEVVGTGQAPYANVVAAGLARFGEISPAGRKAILIEILKASPSYEEVKAELTDEKWNQENIDLLWKSVEQHGWDGAHDAAATEATEAKGAWQQITGEPRWGPRKGVDWKPEGWADALVNMDQEQLKRDAAAVSQDRDSLQRKIGHLEAEIAKDEEAIDRLGERQMMLTEVETEKIKLSSELTAAEAKLAKLPDPSGDSGAECPNCKTQLRPRTDGGFLWFEVFEGPVDKADFDKMVKERAATKKDVDGLRGKLIQLNERTKSLTRLIGAGETAEKEIAGKRQQFEEVKSKGEQLLESCLILTQRARAVELNRLARDKNTEIEMAGKTIKVVEPDGIRRRVLMKRMADFNTRLAKISDAAKWGQVKVDGNFVLRLEGRHYAALSGAQKKAADISVQVAIAMITKASAIVIDAADVFDSRGRGRLVGMLSKVKIPSIVSMTMNKPDKVPDLEKAKMGTSYWVESGVLEPLGQALER